MRDGWKRVGVVLGAAALGYAGGYMNGTAPPGSEKPTTHILSDLGDTAGGAVQSGSKTVQTVVGEAGNLTARAGNAATGAGTGAQNTVPGAPPSGP